MSAEIWNSLVGVFVIFVFVLATIVAVFFFAASGLAFARMLATHKENRMIATLRREHREAEL